MKRSWYVPLLLSVLVSGCHVVDRAERCGQLAKIAKKAAPEIARTTIPDSPPAKTLRKKARLYGQLGEDLSKVHFGDQAVKAARDGLVLNLEDVERHLLEAAKAVDAQGQFLERQRRTEDSHKKLLSEKHAAAPPRSSESDTSLSLGSGKPSTKTNAPLFPRGLPGFGVQAGENRAASGFVPPPLSARISPHSYTYERAKRAVEAATRGVETATRALETVCR